MIEVQKLSKFYGQRKAIDEISFTVEKGEVLGFLGPNGAGKTTTMKILTCFMPASSGTARVAGFDVFEQPLEVKRRVGYLPETPPVYNDMIVADFLAFKAALHGIKGPDAKKAVGSALENCGLSQVGKRLIGNLSKGYQQRVGIAQAIVHNPQVLILDEPTIGLDPKQIIEIRGLIKSLAGERTVVLSTHILPEVQTTCSRVLIINEGKIVASNTLEAISAQLRKGNVISLLVKNNVTGLMGKLRSVNGVANVTEEPADGGAAARFVVTAANGGEIRDAVSEIAVTSGAGLLEIKRESLSLEEVFLKLTTVEPSGSQAGEPSGGAL
ncbi:MAG: ATP-binding cassette domain-containing protein [Deltaproteobacteria bacterium]|nr:ATP-binding cassette domain-containing protein [Deltaproteobacteria bacterium]